MLERPPSPKLAHFPPLLGAVQHWYEQTNKSYIRSTRGGTCHQIWRHKYRVFFSLVPLSINIRLKKLSLKYVDYTETIQHCLWQLLLQILFTIPGFQRLANNKPNLTWKTSQNTSNFIVYIFCCIHICLCFGEQTCLKLLIFGLKYSYGSVPAGGKMAEPCHFF